MKAAQKAFPVWSGMTRADRSKIMMRVSELITQNLNRLAAAESKDNGKPVKLATRVDIPRASDNFSFFATAILHDSSDLHDQDGQYLNYRIPKILQN